MATAKLLYIFGNLVAETAAFEQVGSFQEAFKVVSSRLAADGGFEARPL